MRVSVPDIGLGGANLLSVGLPEFIDVAERAGFRRITVRPSAFVQALAAGWTEAALQRRLADADIAVTMIDGLGNALPGTPLARDLDPEVLARLPSDMLDPPDEEACFRAATALGASMVNVGHYMGSTVALEILADAVAGICQRALPHGLTICLEFIPDTGIPNLPFAQSIVEASEEPNASILLDLFHFDRSGGTVEDIRQLPVGAIAAIQLSDRTPQAGGTPHVPLSGRQLPGEGQLPLRQLVEAALENNPAATIDLEVLNDQLRSLRSDVAAAKLSAAAAAWRSSLNGAP
jgi:sugar phosphate isomerase/epimerase